MMTDTGTASAWEPVGTDCRTDTMKNSRKAIFFVYIRGFNLSEGQAEQMKSAGNENRVIRDFYKLLLKNNDKIG